MDGSRKTSPIKVVLKVIAALLATVIIVVGGYVAYLELTYSRIEDGVAIEPEGCSEALAEQVEPGRQYTVATYNIGFGAYTPDYTFFMDTGYMADGTPTRGEHGTAVSEESVLACTNGAISTLQGLAPDFLFLQEVDDDSDRSYHVNQRAMVEEAFPGHQAYFASNFHSAFLAYPFTDPHGRVSAGLLTLSTHAATDVTRRSYPIDESFPWKYFDLDRCFMVARYPTSDGHQLVLVNSHMSAYDAGGVYRAKQLDLLCGFMTQERDAGNYVIVGGDWNHALAGSESLYPSQQLLPDWVSTFDDDLLPEGFSVVVADNLADVATCRGPDIPYEPGVDYTVTVDGFVVSDNVRATATNVDAGFAYSDHNPVLLTFELTS